MNRTCSSANFHIHPPKVMFLIGILKKKTKIESVNSREGNLKNEYVIINSLIKEKRRDLVGYQVLL